MSQATRRTGRRQATLCCSAILSDPSPKGTPPTTNPYRHNDCTAAATLPTTDRRVLAIPALCLACVVALVHCHSFLFVSPSSLLCPPLVSPVKAYAPDLKPELKENASSPVSADNDFLPLLGMPPEMLRPDFMIPRFVKRLIPPRLFVRDQFSNGTIGKQPLLQKLFHVNPTDNVLKIPLKEIIDDFYDWLDNTPPGRLSIATATALNNITEIALNLTGIFDVTITNIRVRIQSTDCASANAEAHDQLSLYRRG